MFEDFLKTLNNLSRDSFDSFFDFSKYISQEIGDNESFRNKHSFINDDDLASFPEDKISTNLIPGKCLEPNSSFYQPSLILFCLLLTDKNVTR